MNPIESFATEHTIIFLTILLVVIVWVVTLKGFALWKSAQTKNKWWFIALLIVNTMGILELLYLLIFSKKDNEKGGLNEDPEEK